MRSPVQFAELEPVRHRSFTLVSAGTNLLMKRSLIETKFKICPNLQTQRPERNANSEVKALHPCLITWN